MSIAHEERNLYHCYVCDKAFASDILLNNHNLETHEGRNVSSKKVISCEYCDQEFFTQRRYEVHLKIHTREGTAEEENEE